MHVESLDLKRRVALNNQITYILIAIVPWFSRHEILGVHIRLGPQEIMF